MMNICGRQWVLPAFLLVSLLMEPLRVVGLDGTGFLAARKEKRAEGDGILNSGDSDESRLSWLKGHITPRNYAVLKCGVTVEMVQIIDSGTLQDAVQWQYSKRIAQLLVDQAELGTDLSHMGLLNFGGESVQVLELTDPAAQDNTEAKDTIWQLSQLAGDSNLDDAVSAAAQLFSTARDIPHILIVISDFMTEANSTNLATSMASLRSNPNFVAAAVVVGEASLGSTSAAQSIRLITGCTTEGTSVCSNLIRSDFTYPGIMLAASEVRGYTCGALDTITGVVSDDEAA